MRFTERLDFGSLATFVPNKKTPVYNWFYYKEGFSRDLVLMLLNEFRPESCLDPFCGVGTTLLACKEHGIPSMGFDANPLAVFAARVKLRSYDPAVLREHAARLFSLKPVKHEDRVSSLVRRAFPAILLDELLSYRDAILSIGDEALRDFFLLALINASTKSSRAFKDGAVIKFRSGPLPPVRTMFKRVAKQMIKEASKSRFQEVSAEARFGDARSLPLEDGSVGAVITSPPYLNKIEYTRVYSIERELFFADVPEMDVRSAIGLDKQADFLTDSDLPDIARAYFKDMDAVLAELYRVCMPGARVAIVVGNGCFPDRVVESDVILAELAEGKGFTADEVMCVNKRWCMRGRTQRVGPLKESIVKLTREGSC
ncbi:MAG: hypothetical protein JW834_00465 [Candidatus Diapherotrites archaeon]|nr:hypothetical protein [Candidatus Diapherotrites archaeon]